MPSLATDAAERREARMDTQFAPETIRHPVGSSVIYSKQGRCKVIGIETRTVGESSIQFYKLEVEKSPLSRSTRKDPAIWVPVQSAQEQGLRSPIGTSDVQTIMDVLNSREYYFDVRQGWAQLKIQLENSLRKEGAIGLAKVISCLHALKKREIVLSADASKLQENVMLLLVRELSEVTKETHSALEEKITRALRHKLMPDN